MSKSRLAVGLETTLWVILILGSVLLFSGCDPLITMSPTEASAYMKADVCKGDKDCKLFILYQVVCVINTTLFDWDACNCPIAPCSDTSALPTECSASKSRAAASSAPTAPAIDFLKTATIPAMAFNPPGAAYFALAFRQSDGSFTLQGFKRTDTGTVTNTGNIPNAQAYFTLQSGVANSALVAHPNLMGDVPGMAAQPVIITNLGGSAPYASVTTGTGRIWVSTGGQTSPVWQNKTEYALSASANPVVVLASDFNNDGKRDIAVLDQSSSGTVWVLLGNGNGTLQAAQSYTAGMNPVSMTSRDFNGDGRPDLAVLNRGASSTAKSQTVMIYLSNANGTLQPGATYDVPGSYHTPNSIVAADFDGDGKIDLMVGSDGQGLTWYKGTGTGTFVTQDQKAGYTPASAPAYLATGDFNKDGKLDLASLNSDGTATIFLNAGDGSFPTQRRYAVGSQLSSGYYGKGMFATDFNDDGNLDLVFADGHPDALYPNVANISVLFGRGDGSMQGPPAYDVGYAPTAISLADFNGDGLLDVVGSSWNSSTTPIKSTWIMLGQSGGTFQPATSLPSTSYSFVWSGVTDANGDGKLDVIAISNNAPANVVTWLGNGNGTFQNPTTQNVTIPGQYLYPVNGAAGDLNGDGRADVVLVYGNDSLQSGGPDTVSVLTSKSSGGFNAATTVQTGKNAVQAALADVNGDGKLDLIAANFGYNSTDTAPAVTGSVSVSLGKGDGTFLAAASYPAAIHPRAVVVADVNGDGKRDLIVGTSTGSAAQVAVLLGRGDGTFAAAVTTDTFSPVLQFQTADFDKDGKLDLLIIHTEGDRPFTYMRGKGDGTFEAEISIAGGYYPVAAAVADLDGDCKTDLLVATDPDGDKGSLNFFRNISPNVAACQGTAVTITTNPAGGSIVVDGATSTAPQTFTWTAGTTHTINVASPQTFSGGKYTFANWSDGGAQSHTLTTPASAATYTANLTASQYQLTTAVYPAGAGSIAVNPTSADGYYSPGASVQLTATANTGYVFAGWSGDASGTANPQSVTMNAARSVTAVYTTQGGSSGLRFIPVTPCRVADTRNATGAFGGPTMNAGSTRSFTIPSSACSIPQAAQAYSLNVTVVPQGSLGYLSIWPTGSTQPYVSTLNSPDGRIKANAAIVPAGSSGAISLFVTDKTDVILDINGYFTTSADPNGLAFYPVTPCRIADTRNATGAFGGPVMNGGSTRTFNVPQSSCSIPSAAKAYSLNFTVVPRSPLGYLSTWPAGGTQPFVSTLNSPQGKIVANAAIVPAGTSGGVSVFVTDTTDLVIDINGYFAPPGPGGYSFYAVNPCRIADTRNATGAFGGPVMSGGSTRSFTVPQSSCQLPSIATGYSLNVTVVPVGALGYLSMWPSGSAQPYVSTLNSVDGSITANAALVPAGTAGAVSIFVTDAVHVILDVNGYFAP